MISSCSMSAVSLAVNASESGAIGPKESTMVAVQWSRTGAGCTAGIVHSPFRGRARLVMGAGSVDDEASSGGGDDSGALARRAAGGDRAAFAQLLALNYDRLHRMAWRWTGSRTEAEDIAQDVCVKLAQILATWRGEAAFETWLYRVAYRVMIDRARLRRREVLPGTDNVVALFDGPVLSDEREAATPETALLGAELWRAVRALPAQQRDAVLLVYAQDLSHAEAARVMGCSEKTVSWHLHEARKRLKGLLEAVG